MKIAVNTRLLLSNRLEGIGWFTYESLKRITQQHPEHQFLFLFDRPFSNEFIFSSNITPVVIPPPTRHPALWYTWLEYSVPYILKKHKADMFLSTDGFIPLSVSIPLATVIHDINFVHWPKDIPFLTAWYYRYFFPRFAQKASRIATVSEYSKNDISKSYGIDPNKIDVVYNGANVMYRPVKDEEIIRTKKKYTDGSDYFVFVGALLPRKNVARLLEAFEQFCINIEKSNRKPLKLVIVGSAMFKTDDITRVYNSMRFKHHVIFTGRLQPHDLLLVLGSALALTFIPYFEGFGIPIIEAMNCDVPVITSNVTSMPEVSCDAALFVDPFSVESISDAMMNILNDKSLRNNLIEKGRQQRKLFSWQNTADKLWSCVEKVV